MNPINPTQTNATPIQINPSYCYIDNW